MHPESPTRNQKAQDLARYASRCGYVVDWKTSVTVKKPLPEIIEKATAEAVITDSRRRCVTMLMAVCSERLLNSEEKTLIKMTLFSYGPAHTNKPRRPTARWCTWWLEHSRSEPLRTPPRPMRGTMEGPHNYLPRNNAALQARKAQVSSATQQVKSKTGDCYARTASTYVSQCSSFLSFLP